MLDHLDLLDDPAPPVPDTATLAAVRARAHGIRRRAQLTGVGAVVAGLVVVAGVAAFAQGRDRAVDVIAPPSTSTVPTTTASPTSEGTLPNGVHLELTLDTPTVVLGRDITMTVIARNDTDKTLTIGGANGINCKLRLAPALRAPSGQRVSADAVGYRGCRSVGQALRPGETVSIPVALRTFPIVLPDGQRRGRYLVGLVPQSRPNSDWVIPPVRVDVVAPDLRGRLEIPKTEYPAGETVNGTLVIDNTTGEPVEYPVGDCAARSWDVALGQNGTPWPVAIVQPGCYRPNESHQELPVGTGRVPFSVSLAYRMCAGNGPIETDIPRCEPDGGYPPLAPGSYQIIFSGRGAFGSLEIPPVTVVVR